MRNVVPAWMYLLLGEMAREAERASEKRRNSRKSVLKTVSFLNIKNINSHYMNFLATICYARLYFSLKIMALILYAIRIKQQSISHKTTLFAKKLFFNCLANISI